MNDKRLRKELLCNFLLNNNKLEREIETTLLTPFGSTESQYKSSNSNHYIKKVSFRKDINKNLLYSKVYNYDDTQLDFIYKLSKEIEECKKFYK